MKARIIVAAAALAALAPLAGCQTGPAGPAGPSGDAGPPGPGAVATIRIPSNADAPSDAATAVWAALTPQVTVQSVSIPSRPIVTFRVIDATTGAPITGLGNTSRSSTANLAGLTNLSFGIAKLVPGATGAPSRWVSYLVTSLPTTSSAAAPSRPTTDNAGSLEDKGDGTYVYTFYRDVTQVAAQVAAMTVSPPNNTADLGDLSYQPALVHRLTIQLSGNAPGTGTNTPNGVQSVPGVAMTHPVDAIHDFTPSTGQAATGSGRDIVATANCNGCHRQLGGIPGDNPESSAAGFHDGNRNETRYCVVCHTEQRKYGRTEAVANATLTFTSSTYRFWDRSLGNFPNQIHHIHAGPVLAYKNYNYAGVLFNEVLYPQDLRNCTKCHDGSANAPNPTPQGDNWKSVPSRLACGGCHDGIDFATGKGVTLADAAQGKTETPGLAHAGGAQTDDSRCAQCHADVDTPHLPVTAPNPGNALAVTGGNANTNAAWIASNPARLPSGAIAVSYDIQSVTVNAQQQPVMVFRMLQNGTPKPLNDLGTTTPNPKTGDKEIWDDFMGAPSVYFVFSVPQDGISAPADYNATVNGYLKKLWNGTATSGTGAGTLSGPDGSGYYTATLTGVKIPASAVMLTGGLGYSYNVTSTLPLTQTNLSKYPVTDPTASGQTNKQGGLIAIAPNLAKVGTGFNARRPIVEDARCNACHQELGVFTADSFHGGQRNDGTTCSWCHTPNRTSVGWSADSTYFVHAIHAAAKRDKPFTWDATSTTDSFANVAFPGILKDCQTCHLPGTYDFSADASAAALPNKQVRTVATGAFIGTAGQQITQYSGASCSTTAPSAAQDDLGVFELSKYVPLGSTTVFPATPTPSFGFGFSFNAGLSASGSSCGPDGTVIPANPSGGIRDASSDTLVLSPIAGVCFSCHDTDADRAHFEINGGSIYKKRSDALTATETCLICHGTGKIADIAVVHQ